jgi:hypothetical protein
MYLNTNRNHGQLKPLRRREVIAGIEFKKEKLAGLIPTAGLKQFSACPTWKN